VAGRGARLGHGRAGADQVAGEEAPQHQPFRRDRLGQAAGRTIANASVPASSSSEIVSASGAGTWARSQAGAQPKSMLE
jgi:hypothetical protein